MHSLASIHTAVLLFGLAGLIGKLVAVPALGIVFTRASLAALGLGAVLACSRELRPSVVRPHLASLAISGVVLAAHWLTFFQAIRVSTVAIGLLTFASFPLFVTFLEPVCFRERLRAMDIALAAGVVAGLALIVPSFALGDRVTQGAAWGTLSGLTFAVLALMNRQLVRGLGALRLAGAQNAVAALLLAPFAAVTLPLPTGRDVALLVMLGLVCTALAHFLFVRGLAGVRAQVASVITGLEPVYGIVFAAVLPGEVPSTPTLAGGVLILGAALAASRARRDENAVAPR
jgi:drug/metabolite transporter (DMT)-like permease